MVKKFLFPVMILFVVICTVLFISFYNTAKTNAVNNIYAKQKIYLEQAKLGIQNFINNYINVVKSFTKFKSIQNLNNRGKDLIRIFYNNNKDYITSIFKMDKTGRIEYIYPFFSNLMNKNIRNQKHIKKLFKTRKTVISNIFQSVEGFKMVSIHVPILVNNKFYGSLAIGINFKRIAKNYLKPIKIRKNGYAWMIDSKGIELYCPVPGHSGKSVFENCKDYPSIIKMAEKMLQMKSGETTYIFNKVRKEKIYKIKKYAVYMPIKIADSFWSIVIATPEDDVLSNIEIFRNKLIIMMLVILIGGTFLTYQGLKLFLLVKEKQKVKEIEDKLRESEVKYRNYIDNSPTAVFAANEDGNYLEVNNSACKLTGYSEEELTSMSISDIIDETELNKFYKLLKKGKIIEDVNIIKKNGSRIFVRVEAVKIGEKFIAFCTDITPLKKALKNEKNANFYKTEFLANMSHEIRTPLNSILGFTELMMNDENLNDDQKENMDLIKKSGEILIKLITDILTISQIEANKMNIEKENTDMENLLDDVYKLNSLKIKAKRINFKYELNGVKYIYTDPKRLQQIIMNIVGNAVKFTDKGNISISISEHDKYYKFSISDTGIGISKNMLENIFDSFTVGETGLTKKYDGTGLGLNICKKLVFLLGGEIWVESEEDKGSTFYFTIIKEKTEESNIEKKPEFSSDKSIDIKSNKAKPLNLAFLDDEESVLKFLEKSMSLKTNHNISTFIFPEKLLTALRQDEIFDLIFIDIRMPNINGADCLKEIKKINKKIPVIAMTAFALKGDKEKFIEKGFDGYISKPISFDNLIEKINSYF